MNKSYTVSVVIPAYNAEEYLSRTINSVLSQTLLPDEIIVVDDGSTDATSEVAKSYSDKIIYIKQDNAGASAARNTGIKAAKSEWIAFLDADDEWLPEYLEKQIALLKRNPELVWSTGNYYTAFSGQNIRKVWNPINKCKKLLKDNDYFENFFEMYSHSINGNTNTTIIKKKVLEEIGMFDESLVIGGDLFCWCNVALSDASVGFVSKPLSIYVFQVKSLSHRMNKPTEYYIDFIMRLLDIAGSQKESAVFCSFISKLVLSWTRSMFFDERRYSAIKLLNEFSDYIPKLKLLLFRLLAKFPDSTYFVFKTVSVVVRKMNLRKRIVKRH